ncbi:MAG: pitrilysin family protein [Acidimicrobiales bacterium]
MKGARTLEHTQLDNGLRVVIAPDRSTPLVGVAVAYDVGFRSEPEGRTGFAHLFEHMMFQGSRNVAKVEHIRLVESSGGVFNGHTLADLTAYYETLPSGALDLALFLEADRMAAPAITEENLKNQISVVEEEIKVNVLNQPYGGFPWIVLPALAFDTYPNSHNGYGDFSHLEEATVSDAVAFHKSYYSPENAVLAVAGDCDPQEVVRLAERHFDQIPRVATPPHGPWPEPPLREPRRKVIDDPIGPQPAFVIGLRTPDPVRDFDQNLAYSIVASVLSSGEASRLRSRLVHKDRSVTDVGCQLGVFGEDAIFMRDPMLFQVVVHHPGVKRTAQIIGVIDEEMTRLANDGPTEDELERVAIKWRSGFFRALDSLLQRSVSLACLEVIHGRAELIDEIPAKVSEISAGDVALAAADLSSQRQAVVEIRPSKRRRS